MMAGLCCRMNCFKTRFPHCRSVSSRPLTVDNLNPHVRKMEYAVRGLIPIEAMRISNELKKGSKNYPFDKILFANIGDSHAMGQPPLTYVRQLIATCCDPSLINKGIYPSDVIERAKRILQDVGGSMGSYTDSRGIELIRKDVAAYITERDNIEADYNNIYLINGATDGIRTSILLCLMENERAGVMIPIPQYPLYTAAIAELNAHPINYYLNEDSGWSINIDELQKSFDVSREHCKPRLMVVINPGNPTGQYLQEDNLKDIIKFCQKNNLLILADEVYQENIWNDNVKFSSLRKVLLEMGPDYNDVQLVSFNSTSKGYFGECGIRGGYMEMIGFLPDLMEQMYKVFSTRLCANSVGQVVAGVMVKPPKPGEPSYPLFNELYPVEPLNKSYIGTSNFVLCERGCLYTQNVLTMRENENEKERILGSLKQRANLVYERFNKIPGVFCNQLQGAMYAFPRIEIPEEALKLAKQEDPNMSLDTYYCLKFLRETGVCVVPGSGFGQKPGSWHFRTTILPAMNDLEDLIDKFEVFHTNFLKSIT